MTKVLSKLPDSLKKWLIQLNSTHQQKKKKEGHRGEKEEREKNLTYNLSAIISGQL